MKKSKLLFLLPAATIVATIPSVTSCGKQGWTAEDVAHAIMDPLDLEQSNPPKDTLIESIETLSERDRQKELIYDLYSEWMNLPSEKLSNSSLTDLYKNNTVEIVTNITKCSLNVIEKQNTKELQSTFLGYVSFVFVKDYNDSFKKNDYVMITYDIDRFTPEPLHDWAIKFSPADYDLGIVKYRNNGYEKLFHIDYVSTYEDGIKPNSHNWKK